MIVKSLKGKISQEAYIAALEAEVNAMHEISKVTGRFEGMASAGIQAAIMAQLASRVVRIITSDKLGCNHLDSKGLE